MDSKKEIQHVYLVGAKSLGAYGGYETFVYKLTEYHQNTPFLIIGCVYLTLGTFMATSYTVHKDSFGYLFSGSFGAVFNILLNFILIPVIGVYGAALATCISYIRKRIPVWVRGFKKIFSTRRVFHSTGMLSIRG